MVLVPQYDLGASAGAGSLDQTERPAGRMAFDEKWLRDMGANPAGLSMIRADGDSMSPTLSHGDEIMVDRMDGAARLRDGIYVLRMDDTLMVKRVRSEEHTSELQSLMRISYDVFCLTTKKRHKQQRK